jgi:hypothetical protein
MPSLATRHHIEKRRVDLVKRTDAIDASYTAGGAVLSAADVGTDCTITIAAHTRVYPAESGFPTVSLAAGGTVTGLTFATVYYVYYDDIDMRDTTPTYHATTTVLEAQANYVAGRHALGPVTTPADGAGGTSGGGYIPPGGGSGGTAIP